MSIEYVGRDDFALIINQIAIDRYLSSEIMRLQDTFTRNNVSFLVHLAKKISYIIMKCVDGATEEAAEEVAEYLSGLYSYKQREKLALLKQRLPQFAKWFVGSLSQNCALQAFTLQEKMDRALESLTDEVVDESGNMKHPTDGESFALKLDNLYKLKELHSKKNDIVSSLAKKYFGADELDDSKAVFGSYQSKRE